MNYWGPWIRNLGGEGQGKDLTYFECRLLLGLEGMGGFGAGEGFELGWSCWSGFGGAKLIVLGNWAEGYGYESEFLLVRPL